MRQSIRAATIRVRGWRPSRPLDRESRTSLRFSQAELLLGYDRQDMETVTLTIDGRQVTVEKGKKVLQASLEAGISVPYYCYHPGISIDGSCRVCVVKI